MESSVQTIRLDPVTHDYIGGKSSFDAEALTTLIKQRLLLWKGEYFLDTTAGIDYDSILGAKGNKAIPKDSVFIKEIEAIGYGLTVESINVEVGIDRKLTVSFSASSQFGNIEVTI